NGPGIAAEDRARALQPFVRFGAGAAGEGSGLGLSLVAAIARLHRGRLELQSNQPGLRVVVDLPA
ncbi:MAG TPA: ATP-binding protein, partial [Steroidobacteraceae bacterium]|nr:ATP-binding protein [Steroidobacteraceae bacterium]